MLRKMIFFIAIVVSSFAQAFGQSTIYSCNNKYCIELPSKLELQSSELNVVRKVNQPNQKPQLNISTHSGHITFQQKGLNANSREAFGKYCRVIIEYFKENRNDPTFGRGDQIFVDRDLLYAVTEALKENCQRSGTPFLKLISVQPLTINGFPVLYYSYKRMGWLKDDGKRQPPVIVNVFRIFNRYESVTLTFSYREAERDMWKNIHDNIIKTFNFTNKYA